MSRLLRKDVSFEWTKQNDVELEKLKECFSSDAVIVHFQPDLQAIVEADASDFALGAVLSQIHDGVLKPVAFWSFFFIYAAFIRQQQQQQQQQPFNQTL